MTFHGVGMDIFWNNTGTALKCGFSSYLDQPIFQFSLCPLAENLANLHYNVKTIMVVIMN